MNTFRLVVMIAAIGMMWVLNVGVFLLAFYWVLQFLLEIGFATPAGLFNDVVTISLWVAFGLFTLNLIGSQLYSARRAFNKAIPGVIEPLPKEVEYISAAVDLMCSSIRMKRSPRVWLIHSNQVNALAIRRLFSLRGDIAITTGLIASMRNSKHVVWVAGHELGHIVNGDSFPVGFWLAAQGALQDIKTIRNKIVVGSHRLTYRIRYIGKLHYWIIRLFLFLFCLLGVGERITMFVFLIVDRYFSRQAEYAADRVGSELCGYREGVDSLSKFHNPIEPLIGSLYGTHPSTQKRVDALLGLAKFQSMPRSADGVQ